MNQEQTIQRWTAGRKSAVVIDILKGQTTAAQVAKQFDLSVQEVQDWQEKFLESGLTGLRSTPVPRDQKHQAEKQKLKNQIDKLSQQVEAYKIARKYIGLGKP